MRIFDRTLARSIRANSAHWRRPFLAAMTLAVITASALAPATTQVEGCLLLPAGCRFTGRYQLRAGSELVATTQYASDSYLVSQNGMFALKVQPDGLLVLQDLENIGPSGLRELGHERAST